MEHFGHDDCPECGAPSVPYDDVPDQQLRFCPNCNHEWVEDFSLPARKAGDK